jgi:hypothetical protein
VIVPGGHEGKALVHRLQARVAAVLLVEVAVVGQGVGVLAARAAVLEDAIGQHQRVMARLHRPGLEGFAHGLVDVVAEMDDQVGVLVLRDVIEGAQ